MSVAAIIERAARHTGLSADDILGSSPEPQLVHARQAIMAACVGSGYGSGRDVDWTRTYRAVARRLHRDHKTIVRGVRSAERRAKEDPEYASLIAVLKDGAR